MQTNEAPIPKKRYIAPMRLIFHLTVVFCAAFFLLTRPSLLALVRDQHWSPWWLFLGPALFGVLFFTLLIERIVAKRLNFRKLNDLLTVFFGLLVMAPLLSSSLAEYSAHQPQEPLGINLIESFSHHQDARVRALAILALARHNFYDQRTLALIHAGLLDKDPLVQRAAKLVIEGNLGIRFKNGSEGTGQAQQLMRDANPSALLIRKGIP